MMYHVYVENSYDLDPMYIGWYNDPVAAEEHAELLRTTGDGYWPKAETAYVVETSDDNKFLRYM